MRQCAHKRFGSSKKSLGNKPGRRHRNSSLTPAGSFVVGWYLARIYESISSRFHLADRHRSIDGKLKTLDDLYQILSRTRTIG